MANCTHLLYMIVLVILPFAGVDAAYGNHQDRVLGPAAQMNAVLQAIKVEAAAVKQGKLPMRQKANYAQDAAYKPEKALIARQLLAPQHRDPFIDAYVRWQLTSFSPTLPDRSLKQLRPFLLKLPAMENNPLSNPGIIDSVNNLLQVPILSEQRQEQIIRDFTDLSQKRREANDRNKPARELRMWIIKQHAPESAQGVECRAEFVAHLASRGWDATGPKNLLTASCKVAGEEPSIDRRDQERLMQMIESLDGIGSTWINSLQTLDFTIEVEFRSSSIQDFEVRQWTDLLSGKRTQDSDRQGMPQ